MSCAGALIRMYTFSPSINVFVWCEYILFRSLNECIQQDDKCYKSGNGDLSVHSH